MLVKVTRLMKTWDETTTQESTDSLKITRALVAYELSNEISGESKLDYSLAYISEAETIFTGYELVDAVINGFKGSFVLLHEGTLDNSGVKMTVKIISGSGRGELASISGDGEIKSDMEDPMKAHMKLHISLT